MIAIAHPGTRRFLVHIAALLALGMPFASAARMDFNPTLTYGRSYRNYFHTPHLKKAYDYYKEYKIIDRDWASTIPISTQIENAATDQRADLYVPNRYRSGRPVGIYVHINAGDAPSLPAFDPVLEDRYLIGASPAGAGNSRHDPERMARALNLVVSLKARYNVDDSRVYIGGYSGGGLCAALCAMLYPDVFKAAIPTAHSMEEFYWSKIYTLEDMLEMAARGQRFAHIIGNEDGIFHSVERSIGQWEELFDSMALVVDGMGHTNASASDFARCIDWIEAEPAPGQHFEFTDGFPSKLVLPTQLAHSYKLWHSNTLENWKLMDGFPVMGHGQVIDLDISRADRGFYRVEADPTPSFISIPAGSFAMGDSFDEQSYGELPVHTVYVSAFQVQSTEVTHEQMAEVLNWANAEGRILVEPYYVGNSYLWDKIKNMEGDQQELIGYWSNSSRISWRSETGLFAARKSKGRGYPCIGVTWYGAAAYCNFRSEMDGLTPCYSFDDWSCDFSANGYRLPTEAEWERAARGGLSGLRFASSNSISHDDANYHAYHTYSHDTNSYTEDTFHPDWNDLREPYTSPVGSFPPNAFGLYNMAGNVTEMCNDWYSGDYYSSSPSSDPTGPESGSSRVVRGSSWYGSGRNCRVSYRDSVSPGIDNERMGFRPVRR